MATGGTKMSNVQAKSAGTAHAPSLKAGLASAARLLQARPSELRGPYQVKLAKK